MPKQATEFQRKLLGQPIKLESTNILVVQRDNLVPLWIFR
jgi:hypothetical protein